MFRPCIDIHQGKVKQIVGGTFGSNSLKTNFVSEKDSTWYAELFKKHELFGGHVIMLGPGNEEEATNALSAFQEGLQIGGGITPENAVYYLDKGASHIIVTSWLFENAELNYDKLKKLNKIVGKNRLVIDLSCRKQNDDYYVVTNKWQTFTNTKISKETIFSLSDYCDEILIHAADVEGTRTGIDKNLISKLASLAVVPITYAGGANSINDLKTVHEISKGRIHLTIGSALDIFGGQSVIFEEAVAFNNRIKNKTIHE